MANASARGCAGIDGDYTRVEDHEIGSAGGSIFPFLRTKHGSAEAGSGDGEEIAAVDAIGHCASEARTYDECTQNEPR